MFFRKWKCHTPGLGEPFWDCYGQKRSPITTHTITSIQNEHSCFMLKYHRQRLINLTGSCAITGNRLKKMVFHRCQVEELLQIKYPLGTKSIRTSVTDDIHIWGSNNGRRGQQPNQTWRYFKWTSPPNKHLGHGPKSTPYHGWPHKLLASTFVCAILLSTTLQRAITFLQNGSWICVRQTCLQSYILYICWTTSQEQGSKIVTKK